MVEGDSKIPSPPGSGIASRGIEADRCAMMLATGDPDDVIPLGLLVNTGVAGDLETVSGFASCRVAPCSSSINSSSESTSEDSSSTTSICSGKTRPRLFCCVCTCTGDSSGFTSLSIGTMDMGLVPSALARLSVESIRRGTFK